MAKASTSDLALKLRERLSELVQFDPTTADVRSLVAAAGALRDANRAFVRAIRERLDQLAPPARRGVLRFESPESAASFLRPETEQLDVTLLDEVRRAKARPIYELPVTKRQLEILRAAQAGESVAETAARLGIRVKNVYTHRQRIRHRLVGLDNTTFGDAIKEAVRLGLIPADTEAEAVGR